MNAGQPQHLSSQPKNPSDRAMKTNTPMKPDFTQTSPAIAAGVPILELVRKLEDENVFNRYDRLAINNALGDPVRRDSIVRSLQAVELAANPRFAIQKLKMLIHQNEAGLPSRDAIINSGSSPPPVAAAINQLHMQFRNVANNNNHNHGLVVTQSAPTPPSAHSSPGMGGNTSSSHSGSKHHHHHHNQTPDRNSFNKENHPGPKSSSSSSVSSSAHRDNNNNNHNNNHNNNNSNNNSNSKGSPKGSPPPTVPFLQQRSPSKKRIPADGCSLDSEQTRMISNTQSTITNVIGEAPSYAATFGVCAKIGIRLNDIMEFLANSSPNKIRSKRFAVVVGTSSCNPLTRMHMRSYFLAKQYLEGKGGFTVLGSIISPAHGATVRERYRNNRSEIIPSPHRLAVAQLMCQSSKWLAVDPWEITRRRAMDYLSLLQHVSEMLDEHFPGVDIKVFYLCKANMVPLLSPQALRESNYGVISVCRPLECERILREIGAKWNGLIWIAEDGAMLDASMDVVTSRTVRIYVKEGKSVRHWMGDLIDEYFRVHRVGAKMVGDELWETQERQLPHVAARPTLPPMAKHHEQLRSLHQQQHVLQGNFSSIGANSVNGSIINSPGRDYIPSPAARQLLPSLNSVMNQTLGNGAGSGPHALRGGGNSMGGTKPPHDDTISVISELTTFSQAYRGKQKRYNKKPSAPPLLQPLMR